MVPLQRALFDTNEALHDMELLSQDVYITESSLFFAMVMIFALAPLIQKIVDYTLEIDPQQKYTALFIIASVLVALYLLEGYFALLMVFLIVGFYLIIDTYPQYRDIKEYIDKFF
jgi:hypothetical protein